MSRINWKWIIRPIGIISLCSIASGFSSQFYPALITSAIYLVVWAHAEFDWWRTGETKKDIENLKSFFNRP